MRNSTPVTFKRTLIAVAVLSISACSSMPQSPQVDLGGIGSSIAKAGKATANAGRKTWNATTYLLGFSDSRDSGGTEGLSDDQLLTAGSEINSDIDKELPLADAPVDDADRQLTGVDNPVLVEQASSRVREVIRPAEEAIVASNSSKASDGTVQGNEDLIHEVAANETLWDIAKKTTGDATNWHVLADVNNLTQNASVFPGQQLIIPFSMVKPDYDTLNATTDAVTVADAQDSNEAVQEQVADSSRLAIPDNSDEATDQLAQSSEDAAQQIEDKEAQLAAASQNATPFELNAGETLWDFSKRTTGDALNWQAIADQNNFSEKQAVTVRPGQTIYVPESMLSEKASVAVLTDDAVIKFEEEATETASISEQEELVAPEAVEQTLAAALPAVSESVESAQEEVAESSILDETQPIQIVEATYKTDDSLSLTSTEAEALQMAENDNIPANIMVSGTYYPKAVYNNADFSSSLLMRVSPGTTLQVSRAMGTWFEVETDKGIGYVHQRDIK